MVFLFALLGAGIVGAGLALSLAANNRLRYFVGSPAAATLTNFFMSFTILSVILGLSGGNGVAVEKLQDIPVWAFWGGVAGSVSVTLGLVAVPQIGLLTSTIAVVFGQIGMALIIDQFGLLGVVNRSIESTKLIGVALLFAAVILMQLERSHSSQKE